MVESDFDPVDVSHIEGTTNIDFLFPMPEISATGNNGTLFNSGVMVIEPSNCTFKLLMDHINEIESYNGYLNEIFTWWHWIPKHMNYLKHFWVGDDEAVKQKKTKLFGDYDCNWNVDIFHEFASDVAHNKWWRVHDAMPQQLQQFCLLKSKQKAQLEWDRMQAEKENYTDGHWRNQTKDWRLNKCVDNLYSWKSMLHNQGETNWTDDEFFNPSPPDITMTSLSGLGILQGGVKVLIGLCHTEPIKAHNITYGENNSPRRSCSQSPERQRRRIDPQALEDRVKEQDELIRKMTANMKAMKLPDQGKRGGDRRGAQRKYASSPLRRSW
ncbi:hypothetical protein HYC85_000135 [Camellia sinensis]|uniref:Uncharacterized protein n=1 Tax=Camellia sinensis TaxID=4442 RepID=A0A7J7I394_CAMSI|nr:hypothetical protein HYC85_000135 [Camellia sinensis]